MVHTPSEILSEGKGRRSASTAHPLDFVRRFMTEAVEAVAMTVSHSSSPRVGRKYAKRKEHKMRRVRCHRIQQPTLSALQECFADPQVVSTA